MPESLYFQGFGDNWKKERKEEETAIRKQYVWKKWNIFFHLRFYPFPYENARNPVFPRVWRKLEKKRKKRTGSSERIKLCICFSSPLPYHSIRKSRKSSVSKGWKKSGKRKKRFCWQQWTYKTMYLLPSPLPYFSFRKDRNPSIFKGLREIGKK